MIFAMLRRLARRARGPDAELQSWFPAGKASKILETDRRDAGQYRDAEKKTAELREFRHRIASG